MNKVKRPLAGGRIHADLERPLQIGPLDVLIAAHAKSEEIVLVTNIREFERVEGLATEDWRGE